MQLSLHKLWAAALAAAGVRLCAATELTQDAYVWQRAWTDSVTNAVGTLATNFGELVVLRAEVTWSGGSPRVAEARLHYRTLRECGTRVGLALRIGSFPGPFAGDDERCRWLTSWSRSIVEEARTNGIVAAELQLDFDCAESKLDGYRIWLETIKHAVAPVPVGITALPSWLSQPAFARLASVADNWVLQVHSFDKPKSATAPFRLCDPEAAQRAVEKAGLLGHPFRVALPTYGYFIGFDRAGGFLGLSAEGPAQRWPGEANIREVRSNPDELAELVRAWSKARPAALKGIIWYRLPVANEVMNWRWPTLAAVMAGQSPKPQLEVHIRQGTAGPVEIELFNEGNADAAAATVSMSWSGARLIAADGTSGYAFEEAGSGQALLLPGASLRGLAAGERRLVGWLRFDSKADVRAMIHATARH